MRRFFGYVALGSVQQVNYIFTYSGVMEIQYDRYAHPQQSVVGGAFHPYLPVKTGRRFSMKALIASR
uniref:Uncharacterized protein n=1 Tax=Candidatus Kentrum sp. TC TaxID=2126339 RepID=A0A450Z0R6_9GAMM|nr:MAG: hypothetical protein BECKTC1821E_GA0114239_10848 [Candidatus Kentron sp. TC]VFK61941.1 MAG: hypothetical protein BECKTC1821F_GA0114240_106513 [Candidatus Kentron sp. TC]